MKKEFARIMSDHVTGLPAGQVPWDVYLLAMEGYHHDQTPECLEERGGLSWTEFIDCLRDEYHTGNAIRQLKELREQQKR